SRCQLFLALEPDAYSAIDLVISRHLDLSADQSTHVALSLQAPVDHLWVPSPDLDSLSFKPDVDLKPLRYGSAEVLPPRLLRCLASQGHQHVALGIIDAIQLAQRHDQGDTSRGRCVLDFRDRRR